MQHQMQDFHTLLRQNFELLNLYLLTRPTISKHKKQLQFLFKEADTKIIAEDERTRIREK